MKVPEVNFELVYLECAVQNIIDFFDVDSPEHLTIFTSLTMQTPLIHSKCTILQMLIALD